MSTRSFIAKQIGEDKYLTIYCHGDGYPSHNGALLIDHYNSEEKVDELLKLGDLSHLEKNINPDHQSHMVLTMTNGKMMSLLHMEGIEVTLVQKQIFTLLLNLMIQTIGLIMCIFLTRKMVGSILNPVIQKKAYEILRKI